MRHCFVCNENESHFINNDKETDYIEGFLSFIFTCMFSYFFYIENMEGCVVTMHFPVIWIFAKIGDTDFIPCVKNWIEDHFFHFTVIYVTTIIIVGGYKNKEWWN